MTTNNSVKLKLQKNASERSWTCGLEKNKKKVFKATVQVIKGSTILIEGAYEEHLMERELTLGALAFHHIRLQEATNAKTIHGCNTEHVLSSFREPSEFKARPCHRLGDGGPARPVGITLLNNISADIGTTIILWR